MCEVIFVTCIRNYVVQASAEVPAFLRYLAITVQTIVRIK